MKLMDRIIGLILLSIAIAAGLELLDEAHLIDLRAMGSTSIQLDLPAPKHWAY